MDNRKTTAYWIKRLCYLALWCGVFFVLSTGGAAVAGFSMYEAVSFLMVGFIFAITAIFTKPLGTWRKLLCALGAFIIYQIIYIIILPLAGSLAAIIAVIVAGEAQLITQRKWRNKLNA